MSTKVPRVFISATSRELGSYRKAVAEILLKLGALPVVQEHFPPDNRSVVEMLRDKIGGCDAVICLVGRCYGFEPQSGPPTAQAVVYPARVRDRRRAGQAGLTFRGHRRLPARHPDDEPDELAGSNWSTSSGSPRPTASGCRSARSPHLTDQVRVMRFDPRSLAEGVSRQLVVLMRGRAGRPGRRRADGGATRPGSARSSGRSRRCSRTCSTRCGGTAPGGDADATYEVNFETADAAVNAALALHPGLHGVDWPGRPPGCAWASTSARSSGSAGRTSRACSRSAGRWTSAGGSDRHGRAGQTLLTRARVRHRARARPARPPSAGETAAAELRWLSHGRYMLAGLEEVAEVCEVGVGRRGAADGAAEHGGGAAGRLAGRAARCRAGGRPRARRSRAGRAGSSTASSAKGASARSGWPSTTAPRSSASSSSASTPAGSSSFKRELTLFKLLRDALGDRQDIARLLEVELDEAPYLPRERIRRGRQPPRLGHDRRPSGRAGAGGAAPAGGRDRRRGRRGALGGDHPQGPQAEQRVHAAGRPTAAGTRCWRTSASARWRTGRSWSSGGSPWPASPSSLLEPGSSRTGTRMYQPPEANLARPATVQGDVYALGVLLFQTVVGDFDQPLGHGWERRLEAARRRGSAMGDGHVRAAGRTSGMPPPSRPRRDPARRYRRSTPPASWCSACCGTTSASAWTATRPPGWPALRNWWNGCRPWTSGSPPPWPAAVPSGPRSGCDASARRWPPPSWP